jgi:DNA-binding transcriptional regulator YdaS (Cro superfamily)
VGALDSVATDPAAWETPTTHKDNKMTLTEYFSTEPRGAKLEMAEHLGITPTWLSLLMSGRKRASPLLCVKIEEATQQLVTKKELRPDLFL